MINYTIGLVKQHQDLPESIIEKLASDKQRNNFIVHTYVSNKDAYGKTIIFADRWFQCVYIKEKLLEKGIKVDAIYSQIDADPGFCLKHETNVLKVIIKGF